MRRLFLLCMALVSLSVCAQRVDKYGLKVVKEVVCRRANSSASTRWSLSYNDKNEMKSMSVYSVYASGETEMQYKYIRNGNVIHRQKYIDGKFYKWSYVDYYLNENGVVGKMVEMDCAEDNSGNDHKKTMLFRYASHDYIDLPLLEQLEERTQGRLNYRDPYEYTDCGIIVSNEFMYPEYNMIWREANIYPQAGQPYRKWNLLNDVYDEAINDTNIDFNALGGTGWRGRPWGDNDPIRITEYLSTRSRNLLLTTTPTSGNVYSFEYTKDGKGNITQVKIYVSWSYKPKYLYKIINIEYLY